MVLYANSLTGSAHLASWPQIETQQIETQQIETQQTETQQTVLESITAYFTQIMVLLMKAREHPGRSKL